jgi:D-amino peptidase
MSKPASAASTRALSINFTYKRVATLNPIKNQTRQEGIMKIFISADIEGVTGATHWDETDLQKEDSKLYREQMTAEVAAACEGALQAGATEIWVKDAHWTGRNIIATKLPQEARLIRGWGPHPLMMVQGLDESFGGVAFIGYHSRAGAGSSPLAHTMTGKYVYLKINDRYASEFMINAFAAAYLKVPSLFVSGDKGICDEATQLIPGIETVAVKEGLGDSTINIHPDLAITRIRAGMENALREQQQVSLLQLPSHFKVEIQYKDHANAYQLGFFPGAKQIDPTTVQFECQNYYEALRFLLFAP